MLDVLVEIFRILLAVLGIVVVASMIIGIIMIPFENAKKKKENAKTRQTLKEMSEKMSKALIEEVKKEREQENKKTRKPRTKKEGK